MEVLSPKIHKKCIVQGMNKTFFNYRTWIKDALSVVLFVVCVAVTTLLLNAFIFRSFNVVGPSMETTFYTNDHIIINRLPVTIANLQGKTYKPERGQIIVFKNPKYVAGSNIEEYIVKRVIAFGGERVVLKDGKITVFNSNSPNGFNPDANNQSIGHPISGATDIVVPENEIFVSGDHRQGNYSYDSRNGLGTIPLYDVIGPVGVRIFPFDKIRLF